METPAFHSRRITPAENFPSTPKKDGYLDRKPIQAPMDGDRPCRIALKRETAPKTRKTKSVQNSSEPDERPPLPACPFVAGPKIEDPRLFVGREEELSALAWRMKGAQPTSVNVVGERRIGKSSLLYQFSKTWKQRVANGRNYAVIYLSLQDAHFQTSEGFFQSLLNRLCAAVEDCDPEATFIPANGKIDGDAFADALGEWKARRILPVVCLDEFEMFLRYPEEFTDGFYDHLRAQMDRNALMMIVSSRKPLDVYRQEQKLTSSFFNLGHFLLLREFSEDEAKELARLPASTVPGLPPALSDEEQEIALQWGACHPMLLQFACLFLCQARQESKDTAWAENQFQEQTHRFRQ